MMKKQLTRSIDTLAGSAKQALILIIFFGTATPSFAQYTSPLDEQSPLISPDRQALYFTIADHPENMDGKRDQGDIWTCAWENGAWGAPVNMGPRINSVGYNAILGISQDGNRIYTVSSCLSIIGPASKARCFTWSHKVDGRWATPKKLQIPYFNDGGESLQGYITSDERILIFSADYYGSEGAEDIYVSLRNADGKWSDPRNLGEVINTSLQECAPWLDGTRKHLYFATNGRDGYGSFDIYRSERLDDTWTNWSKPTNLGPAVNSKGMEMSYSEYPNIGKALYVSATNSEGYGDIKLMELPPSDNRTDSAVVESADTIASSMFVPPHTSPPFRVMTSIKGRVFEKETNQTIAATVVVSNSHAAPVSISTGESGAFETNLPYSDTYQIQASAFGYNAVEQIVNGSDAIAEGYRVDIAMEPTKSGTTITLSNVLFEQGTSQLLPSSLGELDKVVTFMINHPTFDMQLAGHTDNQGIQAENIRLSRQRVERVKEYLTKGGVEKSRISGDGYGGSRPIASNKSEETRRLNRRVEFTLIKRN